MYPFNVALSQWHAFSTVLRLQILIFAAPLRLRSKTRNVALEPRRGVPLRERLTTLVVRHSTRPDLLLPESRSRESTNRLD